jgi:haloalkane dehalogenase
MQKFMLQAMVRRLTPQELAEYQRPFSTAKSRELLWQFVSELPISAAANPTVIKMIEAASAWLAKTVIPKQLMYAMPGYLTPISTVAYAKKHWLHLSLSELPDSMHFAQETDPAYFAEQLHAWLLRVIP